MPTIKVRSKRQVTIPKAIFDGLGLKEGDCVEITRSKSHIVIKPRKTDDANDILTLEEEKVVEKGFGQLKRGEYVNWDKIKNELDL